jgi:hypothetical protein
LPLKGFGSSVSLMRAAGHTPNLIADVTIHLMLETTVGPDIVLTDLTVSIAVGIVTELLRFILIKIEFHECPFSVEPTMRRKG